jgi:signal peptidase II
MNRKSQIYGLMLACVVTFLDQLSKLCVLKFFENSKRYEHYISSNFNITLVWNKGITFGLFNDLTYGRFIFTSISICLTVALLKYMYNTSKIYLNVALGLIIGGAVGNIIDKIRYGAVLDFLDFHLNSHHWYNFNIADSAICLGVGLLLIENMGLVKYNEQK